jgi:biotin carboxylase
VGPDDSFYFLEVNTRIQVEHTITEVVTGIDIIREQLRIAEGSPSAFPRTRLRNRASPSGAHQRRSPRTTFLANPGVIQVYQSSAGPGVRLDGAIYGATKFRRITTLSW